MEQAKKWSKMIGFGFVAALVFCVVVMMTNHQVPQKPFEVARGQVGGQAFVKVTQNLIQKELDWGWQPNDMFWPTRFLDNRKNFQLGLRIAVWRNIFSLHDDLSRTRQADRWYKELENALNLISISPTSWILPPAGMKYARAIGELEVYSHNLEKGKSMFYARADNLAALLNEYRKVIGADNNLLNPTPSWWVVDDNFHYVRGAAWVMYHSLVAVKIDFADVLKKKDGNTSIDKIIGDLKQCVDLNPQITWNGWGGMANHAANLSSPLSEAAREMENLIQILNNN